MALFGSKSVSATNAATTIKPVIVRSENVAKDLLSAAATNKVAVASLDFNLLETQTFTRINSENKEGEWEELSSDELREINDKTAMLNPNFEIKQVYEVEIFSISGEDPLAGIDISVGANALLTKVYMTIKPGSTVAYYDNLLQDLLKLINKKKLRANLKINIFDEAILPALESLVAKIRVNETYTFKEKLMVLIGEGIEPVATIDDKLILHYEEDKSNKDESGRVDHSKRGYILSVVPGELLIEYIKPKKGENGRNCRGLFIAPKEPDVSNEPAFAVSDKIEVKESDEKIEYIAKEGGYVTFENNTYDIRTAVDVTEISFKTTGSIETALDADVSINVKETDSLKDAIGMGMEVEVNELHVEGNIGSNAKVFAKKATIEGQTHQSAEVHADELQINVHKGKAYGGEVKISRLEQGYVEADKVTISQALGGKIVANEITIEILASHVQMTASNRIEIQRLSGEENHFIIDPICMRSSGESIKESEAKLKVAQQHIKDVEKEIVRYTEISDKNRAVFTDLKMRLASYKKKGIKMPAAFVKKYQELQQVQTHLVSLKQELVEKQERCETLGQSHEAFQSDIFEARIINHDHWKGHNEVKFKLVEPKMEVTFLPPHNSMMKALGLKQHDSGEYYIALVDEE